MLIVMFEGTEWWAYAGTVITASFIRTGDLKVHFFSEAERLKAKLSSRLHLPFKIPICRTGWGSNSRVRCHQTLGVLFFLSLSDSLEPGHKDCLEAILKMRKSLVWLEVVGVLLLTSPRTKPEQHCSNLHVPASHLGIL